MNERSQSILAGLTEVAAGSPFEEDFVARGGVAVPIGPSADALSMLPKGEKPATPYANNVWVKGGVKQVPAGVQQGTTLHKVPKSFLKSMNGMTKPKAKRGSNLTPGRWLAGGAIGATGGVILGGMLSGGTLTPVLVAVAGFLAGTGAAHRSS
jgi:hypothetical protein